MSEPKDRTEATYNAAADHFDDEPLDLARAKAAAAGLRNVAFRRGDLERLDLPDDRFDAVVCVFGIFFAQDIAAAIRGLWRALAHGGVLAITTWGPEVLEPQAAALWRAVGEVRPDLHHAFMPWDRIKTREDLRALLDRAGVGEATIEPASDEFPLSSGEDWWRVVLGTGYRATVDRMKPEERERVRARTLDLVSGIPTTRADVIYSAARKP